MLYLQGEAKNKKLFHCLTIGTVHTSYFKEAKHQKVNVSKKLLKLDVTLKCGCKLLQEEKSDYACQPNTV